MAIVVNDAIGITQCLNNRRHQAIEQQMKPWMESKDSEGISNEYRLIILRQLNGLKNTFHSRRVKRLLRDNQKWKEIFLIAKGLACSFVLMGNNLLK